jgi:hypothetical protein
MGPNKRKKKLMGVAQNPRVFFGMDKKVHLNWSDVERLVAGQKAS